MQSLCPYSDTSGSDQSDDDEGISDSFVNWFLVICVFLCRKPFEQHLTDWKFHAPESGQRQTFKGTI